MTVGEVGEWHSPPQGGSESVEELTCRAVVVIAADLLGDALTQGPHKLDGVFSQTSQGLSNDWDEVHTIGSASLEVGG